MLKQTKSIEADPVNFKFLVVQTAATVLFICETRNPAAYRSPGEGEGEVYDPIAVRLSSYQNWAAHGYTNSLQAMVELVYDYVRMQLDDASQLYLLERSDFHIIVDALAAYQAWKTAHIAADKARLGEGYENFGDATAFNQKDWSDLNERFLEALATT